MILENSATEYVTRSCVEEVHKELVFSEILEYTQGVCAHQYGQNEEVDENSQSVYKDTKIHYNNTGCHHMPTEGMLRRRFRYVVGQPPFPKEL